MAEAPAETPAEFNVPPDFSLKPIGAELYDSKVLPLVPELRSRLAGVLPAGSVLWGAELLNPEDAAGTHVLAKCVARTCENLCTERGTAPTAGCRPPSADACTPARTALSGSCVRAT